MATTSQTLPSMETVAGHQTENGDGENVPFVKGEVQPELYRDKPFAIVFVLQFVGIAGAAFFYMKQTEEAVSDFGEDYDDSTNGANNGYDENKEGSNPGENGSIVGVVALLTIAFASCVLATYFYLRMMVHYSASIIKVAFFMAPVTFLVVALIIAIPGVTKENDVAFLMWILWAFVSMISICYYVCFRKYIPFAAANLRTALTAIGANSGLYAMSVLVQFIAMAYTVMWLSFFVGFFHSTRDENATKEVPCRSIHDDYYNYDENAMCPAPYDGPNMLLVFLFLLCLYWTQQVIQNVLHVTTAGTVGSWWFRTEDSLLTRSSGLCASTCGFTQDISDAFARAMTYSFGSICLGSLLVALMQTLEQIAKTRRTGNRNADLLLCILQFMIACLRAYLEYFNSWAFVYVALYGYDYFSAGRNVIRLFKSRGWNTFISDRLVFRVLLLCQLATAALSGGLTAVGYAVLSSIVPSLSTFSSGAAAFWIGFAIGLILSFTSLFVVESAVRTTLVCFAESASEFHESHPDLSADMKQSWAEAYPTAWAEQIAVVGVPVTESNNSQEGNFIGSHTEKVGQEEAGDKKLRGVV